MMIWMMCGSRKAKTAREDMRVRICIRSLGGIGRGEDGIHFLHPKGNQSLSITPPENNTTHDSVKFFLALTKVRKRLLKQKAFECLEDGGFPNLFEFSF